MVVVPRGLFGKLRDTDYSRILGDFRNLRRGRLELHREAARSGSWLADLFRDQGAYWWEFYELSQAQHMALLCRLLGWADDLKAIAKEKNPARAFLDFMDQRELSSEEQNPLHGMNPAQQCLLVNMITAGMYSMEALGFFSLSMNELIDQARAGDTNSLKRAMSIDRTAILTVAGGQALAQAQLRQAKGVLSGLGTTLKAPHRKRGTYVDLRVMRRVFEEAGAFSDASMPEIAELITERLKVVAPQGAKGLHELFALWKRETSK